METSEEEAVRVEDDDEAEDFARPLPRDDNECAWKVNKRTDSKQKHNHKQTPYNK